LLYPKTVGIRHPSLDCPFGQGVQKPTLGELRVEGDLSSPSQWSNKGDRMNYPLMFTFRDVVSGNGFLAGVTVSGRALMVREDDKWWAYGVRPAGLVDCGDTPQDAHNRFRERYRAILFDIAAEAHNFLNFKQEVERFYEESDADEECRWTVAFEAIRSGAAVPEPPFTDLPRQAPETRPTQIAVLRLDTTSALYTPTDNVPDYFALPQAA
jgi:hypothetical protein